MNKRSFSMDIGSHLIKLVEGRVANNNILIYRHRHIKKEDLEIEEISRKRILKPKSSISINPKHFEIEKTSLPKTNPKNIEKYINSNYYREDYIQQYKYYEREDRFYFNIYSMEIDRVDAYRKLIAKNNLRPKAFDINSNCILKLISNSQLINNTYETRDKNILIMDLGKELLDMSLIRNDNLLFTTFFKYREGLVRDKYFTNKDDIYSYLVDTIKVNLDYSKREYGLDIDLVLFIGGYLGDDDVEKISSSLLDLDIARLGQLDNLYVKDKQFNLALYANAIGGLIREGKIQHV